MMNVNLIIVMKHVQLAQRCLIILMIKNVQRVKVTIY